MTLHETVHGRSNARGPWRPRPPGSAALLATVLTLLACAPEPGPDGPDDAARAGCAAELTLAGMLDPDRVRLVDLTHAYDESTVYWPTSPTRFQFDTLSYGDTPGGWFYSAFTFATPEHGGTHLDAPIHFARGGHTADRVPLERLVAPAIVIDATEAAAADPDYLLSADDIARFESQHGRIPEGTIVLMRTGWDARWPDVLRYLGDDTPDDASNLHFPGFGEDAARLLVEERGVAALGADVASIDYGQSADFPVHRLAMARNVPGLENLANLGELPPTGSVVVALPMKIAGGSGGPLRAIAIVPR
jgi:kynurenine formamidase